MPVLERHPSGIVQYVLCDVWLLPLIITSTKKLLFWGAWVAQSVERSTLDFGSGHDLSVGGIESCVEFCANSLEPAWDILSLSFTAPHSRSQNK